MRIPFVKCQGPVALFEAFRIWFSGAFVNRRISSGNQRPVLRRSAATTGKTIWVIRPHELTLNASSLSAIMNKNALTLLLVAVCCGCKPPGDSAHQTGGLSIAGDDRIYQTNYLSQVLTPGLSETDMYALVGHPFYVEAEPNGVRRFEYIRSDAGGRPAGYWFSAFDVYVKNGKVLHWEPTWDYSPVDRPPKPVPSRQFMVLPAIESAPVDIKAVIEGIRVPNAQVQLTKQERGFLAAVLLQLDAMVQPGSNVYFSVSSDVFQLLVNVEPGIKQLPHEAPHFNPAGDVRLKSIAEILEREYLLKPAMEKYGR